MSSEENCQVFKHDLLDVVLLAYTSLQQDAPESSQFYLNKILSIMFGYLTTEQRLEVDQYLADKKYLPPVNIQIAK